MVIYRNEISTEEPTLKSICFLIQTADDKLKTCLCRLRFPSLSVLLVAPPWLSDFLITARICTVQVLGALPEQQSSSLLLYRDGEIYDMAGVF